MFKIHWPLQNFTVWDDPKFCSAIGGKCDIKLEEVKFMQESGDPGSIPRSDINDIAPVKIQPLGSLYSFSTKIFKKKITSYGILSNQLLTWFSVCFFGLFVSATSAPLLGAWVTFDCFFWLFLAQHWICENPGRLFQAIWSEALYLFKRINV